MTERDIKCGDLFCGAGGTSTGAEQAVKELGYTFTLCCVNHWPVAIETHRKNHPTARHYIEDVAVADPEKIVPEGYLDLLMASPECRFHSRARGGKPIHDQGRMNPWAILRWLTALDVRCLLVENVPEYVNWGPLTPEGHPDPKHKGEYFQAWFFAIQKAGYKAEWRMLNAADHGDATTRIRFFLIARKDGKPIRWPEPSHSATGNGNMVGSRQKWRAAREIINWNDSGRSLFDHPKYQKHPLSPKTIARIAKGLQKFGGPLAPLYINLLGLNKDGQGKDSNAFILNRHGENGYDRAHSVDDPMPTADTRGAGYLVEPFLTPYYGVDKKHSPRAHDVEEPLRTQGTENRFGLAQPFILGKQSTPVIRSVDKPIPSVTQQGSTNLIDPIIIGKQSNSAATRKVDDPVPTVTTSGHPIIIQPVAFVLGQHSGSAARDVDKPIPTVVSDGATALIRPVIIGQHKDVVKSDESPVPGIATHGGISVANPVLLKYNRTGGPRDPEKPLDTLTTDDRYAVVNPIVIEVNHGTTEINQGVIVPYRGERDGQDSRVHSVDDPTPTLTSKNGLALAQFVMQTDQTGGNGSYVRSVDDPVFTLVTKANTGIVEAVLYQGKPIDPRRLVLVNGEPHILDIRFRMLSNDELARAMGFTDNETTYEFVGTKSDVTKQIGNAVPVHLAKALVKAILEV
jgi:DNA (cytosine-5)-methyltransferase 1